MPTRWFRVLRKGELCSVDGYRVYICSSPPAWSFAFAFASRRASKHGGYQKREEGRKRKLVYHISASAAIPRIAAPLRRPQPLILSSVCNGYMLHAVQKFLSQSPLVPKLLLLARKIRSPFSFICSRSRAISHGSEFEFRVLLAVL